MSVGSGLDAEELSSTGLTGSSSSTPALPSDAGAVVSGTKASSSGRGRLQRLRRIRSVPELPKVATETLEPASEIARPEQPAIAAAPEDSGLAAGAGTPAAADDACASSGEARSPSPPVPELVRPGEGVALECAEAPSADAAQGSGAAQERSAAAGARSANAGARSRRLGPGDSGSPPEAEETARRKRDAGDLGRVAPSAKRRIEERSESSDGESCEGSDQNADGWRAWSPLAPNSEQGGADAEGAEGAGGPVETVAGILPNDMYLLMQGNARSAASSSNGLHTSHRSDPATGLRGSLHRLPAIAEQGSSPEHPTGEGDSDPLALARTPPRPKPVEVRILSPNVGEWQYFPTIQAASLTTGVAKNRVSGLCAIQGCHLDWQFRWPGAEAPTGASPEPGPVEGDSDAAGQSPAAEGNGAEAIASGGGPEDAAHPELALAEIPERKKRRLDAKPVEARNEELMGTIEDASSEGCEWLSFASIAAASRETGVPNGSIAALCDTQGFHSGWRFRWPGAALLPPSERPPQDAELRLLAQRIRSIREPAERRAAVAALPEARRQELMRHLREHNDAQCGSSSSRLLLLMEKLPDLLTAAVGVEQRRSLLEGVRSFRAVQCTILAAADVAEVAGILQQVSPEMRRALVETLPQGTFEALTEYLTAQRAKTSGQPAGEAAAPAATSPAMAVEEPTESEAADEDAAAAAARAAEGSASPEVAEGGGAGDPGRGGEDVPMEQHAGQTHSAATVKVGAPSLQVA